MSYDLTNKDIAKLKLETNPNYYDGYTKAIIAKKGDSNSRFLCVGIFSSGEKVDITKFSPSIYFKMPTGEVLSINGQIINENLYFKIYDSLLAKVGDISCEVSLYKKSASIIADTDGSINHTDIGVNKSKFVEKVVQIGTYIFEYNGQDWLIDEDIISLEDYGLSIAENAELFAGDKIIVSYKDYILLTTETFYIVVQENINKDDSGVPVDDGKVYDYIDADDVMTAINQSHIHSNKDVLDKTTASYTEADKTKLTNIDTSLYVEKSTVGKPSGIASLDGSGLIPSSQLPSFVDDVLECYTTNSSDYSQNWLSLTSGGEALLPEKGKIYVVISDGNFKNKQYRWSGTTYILCNPSDVNSVNGKTGIVELTQDDIPDGETFKQTHNDFTNDLKLKLDGIQNGAKDNVQSDWNQTDATKDDFIKNKPIIPDGAKLYSEEGNGTDGAMTQKATTEAVRNNPAVIFAESERQKSKNLFDIGKAVETAVNCTYTTTASSSTITATKPNDEVTISRIALKLEGLTAGKIYTISIGGITFSGSASGGVSELGKLFIGDDDNPDTANYGYLSNDSKSLTFTATGTDLYIKKYLSYATGESTNTIANIQVEEGSVATDYQPYNGGIVYTIGGVMTGELLFKNVGFGIDLENSSSLNTAIKCTRTDTNKSIYFGIGTGGVNRGYYDITKGEWQLYNDGDNVLHIAPFTADGTITANKGLVVKGRPYSGGDDEGIIVQFADNNYAGVTLGDVNGKRSVFYLRNDDTKPFWRYNPDGSTSYDISHPGKAGTIALLDDITNWANKNWSDVNFTTLTVIDTTSLDSNTYYPVTFDTYNRRTKIMLFNDWNGGTPTWSSHASKNYSCIKIWEVNGREWGQAEINRVIFVSSFGWVTDNIDPVRNIGQLGNSSTEYVHVRGGAKYNFYTSNHVVPVLRTSTYTNSGQSVSPSTDISTLPAITPTIVSTDAEQTITANKTFSGTVTIQGSINLLV